MSKYNIKDEVGKNFIKVKALAFFRNFIRNHDSTIFNEDFFEVFIDETFYETTSFEDSVAVTVRKKIIQILKSELDAALLKKIVKFSIDNKRYMSISFFMTLSQCQVAVLKSEARNSKSETVSKKNEILILKTIFETNSKFKVSKLALSAF